MTKEQKEPTVTIVVPNYNHARYLPHSLGSIASQTRAPDEVIVIDDASTDDSVAVIENIIAGRPTWTLIRNVERRGVIARLNEGLARARGEWVLFLGADDGILPLFLERAVEQVDAAPMAGLVSACAAVIDGSNRVAIRPAILPSNGAGYISAERYRELLTYSDNFFHGTVTLYRQRALSSLDGFDSKLGSLADGFVARRLAARFGFSFIPEVLGFWRQHDNNLSVATANDNAAAERLIIRAQTVLAQEPPGTFSHDYGIVLERRLRFGWARLQILSRSTPRGYRAEAIGQLIGAGQIEQSMLRTAMRFGAPGRVGMLSWIALRLRPFSLVRLGLEPLRRLLLGTLSHAGLRRLADSEKVGDIRA